MGFVAPKLTRDGWELRFDHIFLTLTGVMAHQTEPPYDARKGGQIQAGHSVSFEGLFTIDLVDAGDDGRVVVAETDAPAGHYNAVSWSVVTAKEGAWAGKSMVFIGTAKKDGREVAFTLVSDNAHSYRCGEFVGEERKGFLAEGGNADVEMTFHLDHIFGRADKPADDPMNVEAIGFDGFADGGEQTIDLGGLHIGHAGEGHCHVVHGS